MIIIPVIFLLLRPLPTAGTPESSETARKRRFVRKKGGAFRRKVARISENTAMRVGKGFFDP
jgi:hypothetical protein